MLFATPALADELDDLISAQSSYANGDYVRSRQDLLALLSRGDSAAVRLVRPVARKYLAASYFALRQVTEARRVIGELLQEEPSARLDRTQFEAGFVSLYDDVVRAMQPTLDQLISDRALARQRAEVERANRQRLVSQLLHTEAQVEVIPRWQMFVPLGVGQFANHQNGAGAIFLSLEAIFLGGSIATAIADRTVASPTQPDGVWENVGRDDQRATIATTMRILNWTSLSLFAATAIAGIVHANVTYSPTRVLQRTPRPIPSALQGFQISSTQGGASASVFVTF